MQSYRGEVDLVRRTLWCDRLAHSKFLIHDLGINNVSHSKFLINKVKAAHSKFFIRNRFLQERNYNR